jgi:hypothetical protein
VSAEAARPDRCQIGDNAAGKPPFREVAAPDFAGSAVEAAVTGLGPRLGPRLGLGLGLGLEV